MKATQLSQRDIIEERDGEAASATVVEAIFEPGQKDSPHHYTGVGTHLLAVILHFRDTKETTLPEKGKE